MLNSFSLFSVPFTTEEIELFRECIPNTEGTAYKSKHVYEILEAYRCGRINANHFNIRAYEYTIEKNNDKSQSKNAKKNIVIKGSSNSDEVEESSGMTEEQIYKILAGRGGFGKSPDEDLLREDEIETAKEQLVKYAKEFRLSEDLDLFSVIKNAIKGVGDAVCILKDVASRYEEFGTHLRVLLKNRVIDELC